MSYIQNTRQFIRRYTRAVFKRTHMQTVHIYYSCIAEAPFNRGMRPPFLPQRGADTFLQWHASAVPSRLTAAQPPPEKLQVTSPPTGYSAAIPLRFISTHSSDFTSLDYFAVLRAASESNEYGFYSSILAPLVFHAALWLFLKDTWELLPARGHHDLSLRFCLVNLCPQCDATACKLPRFTYHR